MSYATIFSACMHGSQVIPLQVETDIHPGLPQLSIIGLPDRQIDEARSRVRTAIRNSGFMFPSGRITVNLAPSNIPKYGSGLDLAIAVSILAAAGKKELQTPYWVLGQLSLDGFVQSYQHLFPILLAAQKQKVKGCITPSSDDGNLRIASAPRLEVCSIKDLVEKLTKRQSPAIQLWRDQSPTQRLESSFLLDTINGQSEAKRALAIALAGGHNLLMSGPAGAGKSLLAQAAVELLPNLTLEERADLISIQALSNIQINFEDSLRPPLRMPHHQISVSSLIGGGSPCLPGEVSLAEHGILFLDEFNQMSSNAKEALKEPLQEKRVLLRRKGQEYVFPASCMVIAAQNPCPCGNYGSSDAVCICRPGQIQEYRQKVSEPVLDRFDLFLNVPSLSSVKEVSDSKAAYFAEQIMISRATQHRRQGISTLNSQLKNKELESVIPLSQPMHDLIDKAMRVYHLSMRGVHKVMRTARTIADFDGFAEVGIEQLQEALRYRIRQPVQ